MAFKILYHEDALADLEGIFSWSKERHPETTEQFANDLFNHVDFLQSYPYIGTPVKGHLYYRVDENRGGIEILHFWHTARQEPNF